MAKYAYDGTAPVSCSPTLTITNGVGRRTGMCDGAGWEAWSYDEMGRSVSQWQCTPANCGTGWFASSYGYNLIGGITSLANPFGFTLGQTYNSAAQITQQTSTLSDTEHPGTLASEFVYNAPSGVTQVKMGNVLYESRQYNNRLQPTEIRTYPQSGPDALKFTYGYTDIQGRNNGNVWSWNATGAQVFTRTYDYDRLNRLTSITGTGGNCRDLTWTYDPWANRTNQNKQAGQSCGEHHPTILPSNRISELGYDAAGNVISDTGTSYQYDAENRMTSSSGSLGTGNYVYDAIGHRVQKTVNGTTITDFAYDLGGSVVAEREGTNWTKGYIYLNGQLHAQYDNTVNPTTTYFFHKDHLGSTRLLTKMNQSSQECAGYLPYGEFDTSVCVTQSSTTATTHKFTGKEADTESSLDYFGARYYSANAGRFLSVDPSRHGVDRADAQSWNRYAYARNNPLLYVDPNGQWSTWFHEWLIDKVFGDPHHVFFYLSPEERQILKMESKAVDEDQSTAGSFQHGMSQPGEEFDREGSMGAFDRFVTSNVQSAVTLEVSARIRGDNNTHMAALMFFGKALHAYVDATSPVHEGFQVWYGWRNPLVAGYHLTNEAVRTFVHSGTAVEEAVYAAKRLWAFFQAQVTQQLKDACKRGQKEACEALKKQNEDGSPKKTGK